MFLDSEGVDLGLTLLAAKSLQLSVEFCPTTDVALEAVRCGRQCHLRSFSFGVDLLGVAFR